MELYSVIEKDKIMKLERRWMDLEITPVSESTHTRKDKYVSRVSPILTLAFNCAFGCGYRSQN